MSVVYIIKIFYHANSNHDNLDKEELDFSILSSMEWSHLQSLQARGHSSVLLGAIHLPNE